MPHRRIHRTRRIPYKSSRSSSRSSPYKYSAPSSSPYKIPSPSFSNPFKGLYDKFLSGGEDINKRKYLKYKSKYENIRS